MGQQMPQERGVTFHQVLIQWVSCRQYHAEPEFYCVHQRDEVEDEHAYRRAQQHDEEQQWIGNVRKTEPLECIPGNPQCVLSVRVDDAKGCARKPFAEPLLKHLDESVGRCKAAYSSFLHTGVQHEHSLGAVFPHDHVYIESIVPVDNNLLTGNEDEAECCATFREAYRSVLGAVAWTVLSRAELAVYVQALRRSAHTHTTQYRLQEV